MIEEKLIFIDDFLREVLTSAERNIETNLMELTTALLWDDSQEDDKNEKRYTAADLMFTMGMINHLVKEEIKTATDTTQFIMSRLFEDVGVIKTLMRRERKEE